MPVVRGSCHCGALEVELEASVPVEKLTVRACDCTFCRRHNSRNTTDPAGRARFIVHDRAALVRYRFGLKTADFILCARCGVYLGALMDDSLATINVNVFDDRDRFRPPEPVSYDGEDAATRIARRRSRWTPASLDIV